MIEKVCFAQDLLHHVHSKAPLWVLQRTLCKIQGDFQDIHQRQGRIFCHLFMLSSKVKDSAWAIQWLQQECCASNSLPRSTTITLYFLPCLAESPIIGQNLEYNTTLCQNNSLWGSKQAQYQHQQFERHQFLTEQVFCVIFVETLYDKSKILFDRSFLH